MEKEREEQVAARRKSNEQTRTERAKSSSSQPYAIPRSGVGDGFVGGLTETLQAIAIIVRSKKEFDEATGGGGAVSAPGATQGNVASAADGATHRNPAGQAVGYSYRLDGIILHFGLYGTKKGHTQGYPFAAGAAQS
jgi:hypothetical protein